MKKIPRVSVSLSGIVDGGGGGLWLAATWTRKGMDRLWRKRRRGKCLAKEKKERKKERKEERERERKRERANLHALGAVEMSVEIE